MGWFQPIDSRLKLSRNQQQESKRRGRRGRRGFRKGSQRKALLCGSRTYSEQNRWASRIVSRGGFQIMRDPFLAGILSLLIPGVGQIYNGRVVIGIIWLIVTGVSWIGSVGILGWIIHLVSAWCAYSYAKDHPVRT